MSLVIVGLLILAAAGMVALLGIGVRVLAGRYRADDAELDEKILMPTIVVVGGLVVTAVFVFGYDLIG